MTGDRDSAEAGDDTQKQIEQDVLEEMQEKEPADGQKAELREEHRHHLVRDTESELTIELDVAEGMDAEATIIVPDIYCFRCGVWVGLSGIDLRGTPRSRADAYYLDGPPEGVEDVRHRVTNTVGDLVEDVAENVPHVEDVEDALDFIETEVEQARERRRRIESA